jgi:hypothetical protein
MGNGGMTLLTAIRNIFLMALVTGEGLCGMVGRNL